jgi:hypothetical protein
MSCAQADTYVVAFRSWIRHHGNGGPFGDVGRPEYSAQLEPRLSHTQLLDRWGAGVQVIRLNTV